MDWTERAVVMAVMLSSFAADLPAADHPVYAIIVHGGAGDIRPERVPDAVAASYRQRLRAALEVGQAILARGGSAVAAVVETVAALEDDPYFNAGVGSVLNAAGRVEMDASLMSGDARRSGAVAAVGRVRHPIRAAQAVMDHSKHILLVGAGAESFAEEHGITMADNGLFITDWQQRHWQSVRQAAEAETAGGADEDAGAEVDSTDNDGAVIGRWLGLGTVGCVALDQQGHLAAATSTGGTVDKTPGRVGDSAIIGAGTYALDGVCAISATGHGESFLTVSAAHRIARSVAEHGLSLEQAADEALAAVGQVGGTGGVIVLGADGTICLRFTSPGMFRAWVSSGTTAQVRLFGPDDEGSEDVGLRR